MGRICSMERCVTMIGIMCLLVPVSGQQGGGVLCCEKTWNEGSNITLTFFIDESKLQSQCRSTNNQPFFQRSTDETSINARSNCTVSDITAPGACSGSFESGTLGCGCTLKQMGYYVVEYNFIAHPDYNGWWTAGIQCLDLANAQILSFASLHCGNKQTQTETDQMDSLIKRLQELLDLVNSIHSIVVGNVTMIAVLGSGGSSYIVFKIYKGNQSETDKEKEGETGAQPKHRPKQNQTSPSAQTP